MTKLIVLTDVHMVAHGERILDLDPYARLEAAIRHIGAAHPDADHLIVTGDLTHRGEPAAYARLQTLLGRLAMPWSLLVGNHERRAVFCDCFPNAPRDEHGFVQRALDIGGHRLILLDTALGQPGTDPEAHWGVLCNRRLAWLDAQLAAAERMPVLIFMHHPPHATGFPGMDRIALRNGDEFYRLVARRRNVRHIVAGHVHRTIGGSFRGIPFSIFKSPVHQQPMDLHSLDTALSVDEPAAYGIILLGPDGVIVHTEDYELAEAATPRREAASGVVDPGMADAAPG